MKNITLLLSFIILLTCGNAFSQAAFTASPEDGCDVPHTVTFTNTTPGNNTYVWNFGDATSSIDVNPVHVYTTAGVFTVLLTATNVDTGVVTSVNSEITVIVSNSDFTASVVSDCGPLSVDFTDISTADGGFFTLWAWDFGDGTTSSLQNPTHVYTTPGVYTVSLITTVNNGCSRTELKTDFITVRGLDVDFSTPDTTTGAPPLTVNFVDNTIISAPVISWEWDFGDGTISTLQNPTKTYDATQCGIFTVTLTVTDQDGCSGSEVKTDFITLLDTEPPVITCPMDLTENATNGCLFTIPDYSGLATASDNCVMPVIITQTPAAGTVVGVGNTLITLEASDGMNTVDCTFNVTVVDGPPIAICQNVTIELDVNGEASITAADIDGGSFDNCGTIMLDVSQTNFDCSDLDLGVSTLPPLLITGVYDGPLPSGVPKGIELKVQQNIADLSLYGIGSANNGGGSDGEEFSFPAVAAAEGDYIYVSSESGGFTSFFGFTPNFTNNALGVNGNDAIELFFNGAVIDTFGDINTDGTGEPWEYLDGWAYRNNDQSVNNGAFNPANWTYSGINALDGEITNATATTPFPAATFTTSPTSAVVLTVTLIVTDDNGNVATCEAEVTLEDNLAPEITTCPSNQTGSSDINCQFEMLDYTALAVVTDNCPTTIITQEPAAGTIVGTGITMITIFATDGTNSVSCQFELDVIDDTPPEIICPVDITVSVDNNCEFILDDYTLITTGTDNCVNPVPITQTPAPGTPIGPGTTQILLEATDGTNVVSCMFEITVIDDIAPILNCPANETVSPDALCQFVIPDYTVIAISSDNCGIVNLIQTPPAGTVVPLGITSILLEADDGVNDTSCSFDITVADDIMPTAICQDLTVTLDAFGVAIITAADLDGGSSDSCGNVTTTIDIDTFDCSNVGLNDVTLTVTDDAGNISTCIAVVTVIDDIGPDAICQDITVQLDANGVGSITATDVDGGSTDACGIDTIAIDIENFDCSNVGLNTVTLTVTDINGNTSTCMATVTITQTVLPPVAICQSITVVLPQSGLITLLPEDVDNGSSGQGCVDGLTIDRDDFSCDDIGMPTQVTLTVTNADGVTDSCIATVTVVDNLPPTVTCPPNQSVTSTGPYELPDYFAIGLATATDNCTTTITTFDQDPNPGTLLTQGFYTITLTAEDDNGFEGECEFILFVDDVLGITSPEVALNKVNLFPNPANDVINISNPQLVNIETVSIYDITGRLVQVEKLNETQNQTTFNISALQSARYLVIIESEFGQIIKQLVKE